jgi:adenylate cyclase
MPHSIKIRITLAHLFSISLIVLIVLLSLLYYILLKTSKESVMGASDNLRNAASRELAQKVSSYLNQAKEALNSFQSEITHQVFDPRDSKDLETILFSLMLTNSNLSEISFIYGDRVGYDAAGDIQLAPTGRGEMSLFRTSSRSSAAIDTRYTYQKKGKWVSELRLRTDQNDLFGAPFILDTHSVSDPTNHLTFATPANMYNMGENLWSDLHWSQVDKDLSDKKHRVEVSLQRTITDTEGTDTEGTDTEGNFLGVLKVGLFQNQINKISAFKITPNNQKDPHIIFITDPAGELITSLNPNDTLRLVGNNLRFETKNATPQVQMSLQNPLLNLVNEDHPIQYGSFDFEGETYLVTYRWIQGSQGWILGIVVPQSYYVGPLQLIRNRLLFITSIIIFCLALGGYFLQRFLKKEQAKIFDETEKISNFNFEKSKPNSFFRDVYEILTSLELAKTAMRAMSRYVPIDLVRQLYQTQKEPTLGGESQEVSMLFTDIENFTTISEKLPVNQLAEALGIYLSLMTQIIQNKRKGIIDKYIGDGIMALWNAPTLLPNHAQAACQATLDCRAALDELFASPKWKDLTRFETRFGLHKDQVMIGHFGAPDRMNFTAIGNGVNVASRLEGLNKQYGTHILVSEAIYESAKEVFAFRLIDRVAVKGTIEGIKVYELIGKKGENPEMNAIITHYELALQAYQNKHFDEAKNLVKDQLHDGPSLTLYTRCLQFLQNPPPPMWNGIYISTSK